VARQSIDSGVERVSVRSFLRVALRAGKAAALIAALIASAASPARPQDSNIGVRSLQTQVEAQAEHQALAHLAQLQPKLLGSEVAALAPHSKGKTDIYAIGVAGWATLDVFTKELDGGLAAIGRVLPIKHHVVRLINHPATAPYLPLASPHNFAAAVHDVGKLMDKRNDVLVLLLTSHGDRSGFALQLPDRIVDLTPKFLAATLAREGIKNRVVIVSACFSGIFVRPLKDDNTIIMTAADATHTSFGCAPEREWTYFGDALFRQALLPGTDFRNAFEHARILIQGWELMDHLPPSNPQGFFGRALVTKLAPFFAAAPAAAAQ
jgi:hypothetical protein